MRKLHWQFYLGISLIALSATMYFAHYLLFQDVHHILIYLMGDIAFVPIEVLLVTLIIHKLIDAKEKRKIKDKLNIVIGVFFSEIGTRLLEIFSALDQNRRQITEDIIVGKDWTEKDYKRALKKIESSDFKVETNISDLEAIETLLHSKRDFLIKLLENPALLERDRFTELLRAVFHLEDELKIRINIHEITGPEKTHIETDIVRAYKLLIYEWIIYMKYLQNRHPYFFFFALETCPIKKMAAQN